MIFGKFGHAAANLWRNTSRFVAANPFKPDADFWYDDAIGQQSLAGVNVTSDSAMQLSAVQACVRLKAGALAMLPIRTYRRHSGRRLEELFDHWLAVFLDGSGPNAWQTWFEYREMMESHVQLRGNGYARKFYGNVTGGERPVRELVPIHPDLVKVKRSKETGDLIYEVTDPEKKKRGGKPDVFLRDEIMHIRDLSADGIVGLSRISQVREGLGAAIATDIHVARFFGGGAHPSVVLSSDQNIDQKTAEEYGSRFDRRHGGPYKSGGTAVLGGGLKVYTVSVSNKDAQFLETRKFQVEDIARLFGVPPHMIGHTTPSTSFGSGLESMVRGFSLFSIGCPSTRWEQAIRRDLIRRPEIIVQVDMNELNRATMKERFEAWAVARRGKWMSANDVRRKEGENPIDGGDVYENPDIETTPENTIPAKPANGKSGAVSVEAAA